MASGPGPRQVFNQHATAIHFFSGRFLVIEVHKIEQNTTAVIKPIASSFGAFEPTKKMPFVEGGKRTKKPDGLSMKADKLLHAVEWLDEHNDVALGDPNPGYTKETRDIIFINLGLVQAGLKPAQRQTTFDFKLEGIPAEEIAGSGDRQFAYWMWETEFLSSSNGNLGIGPAPSTLEEALSIKTFTYYYGATSTGPWIGELNNSGLNDFIRSANRRASQVGVAPAPEQSNDGYGWATEADQTTAINYLNAYLVWNEQFSHDSNHQTYFAVTFPLTTKGPKTTRKVEYKIKAGYYAGRLNFPYDTTSTPQFPIASDDTTSDDKNERYAEYTTTKNQPSADTTIRVKIDKDNHVTIAQQS